MRELCCRTGDHGDPIAPVRWPFFAQVWIEPYRTLLPEWTYVAESAGALAGYLTGCSNTRSFVRARRWRVVLPLLAAIAVGRYRGTPDASAYARRALGLIPALEDGFRGSVQRSLYRDYPAHLHINLDASYRRRGIGRRLIERYLNDLKSAGAGGVHLFCGPDPVEFYRRLGFRELQRREIGGRPVFVMVKRI